MDVIGYARVSTLSQDLDLQISEINKFVNDKGHKMVAMFTDKASGKNLDRPGFSEMIDFIDSLDDYKGKTYDFIVDGKVDIKSFVRNMELSSSDVKMVVIQRLDRIGRNTVDLMKIIDFLKSRNIHLVSVLEDLDTTTPKGVLSMQILASYAEYELNIIRERTSNGLKKALADGNVKFGRPKKEVDISEIKKDLAIGLSKSKICKKYGLKRTTLYNKLKEAQDIESLKEKMVERAKIELRKEEIDKEIMDQEKKAIDKSNLIGRKYDNLLY